MGDTDEEIVLKGVVRVQTIEDPETYIPAILKRVRKEYIYNAYGVANWDSPEDFIEKFCRKTGKLLKKGEPDIHNACSMILSDWQRGRLPYFIAPEIDEAEKKKLTAHKKKNKDTDITAEQLFNNIPVKNKFILQDAEPPPGMSLSDEKPNADTNPKNTENENKQKQVNEKSSPPKEKDEQKQEIDQKKETAVSPKNLLTEGNSKKKRWTEK